MSTGELRVSLRLKAGNEEGQLFEDVTVQDTSCSLASFLDGALKYLEVRVVYVFNDEVLLNVIVDCAVSLRWLFSV